ncbi:MAG: carnitine 3-dehydrogenase [Rhizobiaceae bacterium]|nr:carnitine 3-dehydrogenase [Rhizobiaceae bacterium]
MTDIAAAAAVGGGVIGGAWAARFIFNGIDCKIFDPHPEAERIVGEVMANAERAYDLLTDAPFPTRGELRFVHSVEEAVEDTDIIQESVPERLELKQKVHMQIDAAAPENALIGSSTSGLLPTDIQAKMMNPERMFVAHPYNPVYLLPLVELVAGRQTSSETIERADRAYQQIGMKPVVIRKEIDAFVGDRLLEAVWREALWLIKDDVATTEELDDIMRYSFGMRWAQMGLFETYRIAGGEAGMRHFIEQFGPTVSLPWTKLMDVPELDDALIDKIASQSDAQSGHLGIRDLERIRDENLVGIMQVLARGHGGEGWGAGKLLKDYEAQLRAKAANDR